MNVTIGQTTYRSLHDAADAYKTNVSTLAHYRKKIKNCQRLERFLVLNQLQQLLVNPDVSNAAADSVYKMMLHQLTSAPVVVAQAAPAAKKTSRRRLSKSAYAYDTTVDAFKCVPVTTDPEQIRNIILSQNYVTYEVDEEKLENADQTALKRLANELINSSVVSEYAAALTKDNQAGQTKMGEWIAEEWLPDLAEFDGGGFWFVPNNH